MDWRRPVSAQVPRGRLGSRRLQELPWNRRARPQATRTNLSPDHLVKPPISDTDEINQQVPAPPWLHCLSPRAAPFWPKIISCSQLGAIMKLRPEAIATTVPLAAPSTRPCRRMELPGNTIAPCRMLRFRPLSRQCGHRTQIALRLPLSSPAARVRATLRRSSWARSRSTSRAGASRWRAAVELTATEYALLRTLSLNVGRVMLYEALVRQVRGEREHAGLGGSPGDRR